MPVAIEKKRAVRPRKPTKDEIDRMTLGEYIRYRCRDRRSTLAYFKETGLTYDKNGNPVVRPM